MPERHDLTKDPRRDPQSSGLAQTIPPDPGGHPHSTGAALLVRTAYEIRAQHPRPHRGK